jgi:outer membrane receptor protein involved in Fe transport
VGLVWKPDSTWRWHAAAYRGFRLPTLNEYYRPFRVGTVTTNANPNLQVETLNGIEAGIGASRGPWEGGLTVFGDQFLNAVGTVTVSQSPTATTVQRQNLDAVRIPGMEASFSWRVDEALRLRAGFLYNDSSITRASAEPDLVGLRLPEVPRQTVTAEADFSAPFAVTVGARVRWVSMQFDDNANTLRLPAATVVDLELARPLGRKAKVFMAVENAANAAVATSLSTTGLFTYDAPRLLRGGVELAW